jgi:hypothetical protein
MNKVILGMERQWVLSEGGTEYPKYHSDECQISEGKEKDMAI